MTVIKKPLNNLLLTIKNSVTLMEISGLWPLHDLPLLVIVIPNRSATLA